MEEIPSAEDEKPHADPGWLLQNRPEDVKPPVSPAAEAASTDGAYELIGDEPGAAMEESPPPVVPPRVVPPPLPGTPPRPPLPKGAGDATTRSGAAPATVDVIWTRWGEWGPDLARLGAAALVTMFFLFLAVSTAFHPLVMLLFMAGLAGMALLSYPLAITMERPVRVTPEQAVKDYFGALSHSVPHYRRMWLLLSSAGRSCPEFRSLEGFQAYWKSTLAALGDGVPARFNPFLFEVDDFRSEKSHGLTAVEGTFTLRVRHRRLADRPVRAFRVELGLVKGPDRMWYLNTGTMPKGGSASRP